MYTQAHTAADSEVAQLQQQLAAANKECAAWKQRFSDVKFGNVAV